MTQKHHVNEMMTIEQFCIFDFDILYRVAVCQPMYYFSFNEYIWHILSPKENSQFIPISLYKNIYYLLAHLQIRGCTCRNVFA